MFTYLDTKALATSLERFQEAKQELEHLFDDLVSDLDTAVTDLEQEEEDEDTEEDLKETIKELKAQLTKLIEEIKFANGFIEGPMVDVEREIDDILLEIREPVEFPEPVS